MMKVGKIDSNSLAFSNHVYINPADGAKFAASPYIKINSDAAEFVFNCAKDRDPRNSRRIIFI